VKPSKWLPLCLFMMGVAFADDAFPPKQPAPPTKQVLEQLRDEDPRVVCSTLDDLTLAETREPAVMRRIIELTRERSSSVRGRAVAALGELGPKYRLQVEKPLQAALGDPDGETRIAAAGAISQIDGTLDRTIEVLTKMVAEDPQDPKLKKAIFPSSVLPAAAAEALGALEGDAAPATDALSEALKSPYLAVRLAAAEALGRIGPAAGNATPALSTALRETERHSIPFAHRSWCVGDNAARALESIGVAAVPMLIDALKDEDPAVRMYAIRSLGNIPEAAEHTVSPISQRLQDPHPTVRIEAAKAIGKFETAGASAAPRLARLLIDDRAFTSFSGGVAGIGHTESVRAEAWLALRKIEPEANQVVPMLVRSLEQADDVPYEAIAAMRAYDGHLAAAKDPLERLLSNKKARAGAATALAFVDPHRTGLRRILEDELIEGEGLNAIAAIGLGRLAEKGEKIDDDVRQRLNDLARERQDLFGICCLLRQDPDNERTAKLLVEALRDAHDVFEAIGIREAELTLRDLARHPNVKKALLAELEVVIENPEIPDEDPEWIEYLRVRTQEHARLRAAKILVAAQLEFKQAVHCLDILAAGDNPTVQGAAADILVDCRTERQAAIDILTKLLRSNVRYGVGGDFYGNGADRRVVGDRAAQTLVALGDSATLLAALNDQDIDVRIRTIRALSDFGGEGATDELLRGARDSDYRVRRQTMSTLGSLGRENGANREKLEKALQAAVRNDRRRSVRDEAKRALDNWK
jgi:HEAT repeat protein